MSKDVAKYIWQLVEQATFNDELENTRRMVQSSKEPELFDAEYWKRIVVKRIQTCFRPNEADKIKFGTIPPKDYKHICVHPDDQTKLEIMATDLFSFRQDFLHWDKDYKPFCFITITSPFYRRLIQEVLVPLNLSYNIGFQKGCVDLLFYISVEAWYKVGPVL